MSVMESLLQFVAFLLLHTASSKTIKLPKNKSKTEDGCLGPFQLCDSGDCALSSNACGTCASGQYTCPINQNSCVDSVDDYIKCSGLSGTHLDWTLSIQERLNFLANNLSLDEKVSQLTNDAPEIYRLGIPSYNWLDDDVHGVRQSHQTTFPDGCGLGATWSRQDLKGVGNIMAYEARALYNANVEIGNRGAGENGYTITAYGPNINLGLYVSLIFFFFFRLIILAQKFIEHVYT